MTAKKIEQKKIIYEVVVVRKDQRHIIALESDNYDKCYAIWKDLHTKWTESVKEVKPFILEDPIITAFEPGLISEILLQPLMESSMSESVNSNPYQRRMMEHGLASTLKGHDLLEQTRSY